MTLSTPSKNEIIPQRDDPVELAGLRLACVRIPICNGLSILQLFYILHILMTI
jgi:hypothetical protein